MKSIPLTQGKFALVDDEDYEWLSRHRWYAKRSFWSGSFYAARATEHDEHGKQKTIFMHREILGLKYGDKRRGDHKEVIETLNNQRSNLRIATFAQNNYNSRCKPNRLGLRGIQTMSSGRFRAKMRIAGKMTHLGTRDTREEAHQLYCEAVAKHHGEFARTT